MKYTPIIDDEHQKRNKLLFYVMVGIVAMTLFSMALESNALTIIGASLCIAFELFVLIDMELDWRINHKSKINKVG